MRARVNLSQRGASMKASPGELLTWPERQLIRELEERLATKSARWRKLKFIGQRNGELTKIETEMRKIRSEILSLQNELKRA